jgi:hypothetical protein
MNRRSLVLGLFARQLNLGTDPVALVDSDLGRLRIQKAIYLAQRCGIDFGYRYSWYKKGPYCPTLTADYYDLRNSVAWGEDLPAATQLRFSDEGLPLRLSTLFQPAQAYLPGEPEEKRKAYWLELLASLDYLTAVERLGMDQSIARLRESKQHLLDGGEADSIALAREALRAAAL